MTLASAAFWLTMAAVAAFAGLDAGALALFFAIGVALVYPAGYVINRACGGDLLARGSVFRELVGVVLPGEWLAAPIVIALLLTELRLVTFALAISLGAHFLPFAWLYRSPAYYALGIGTPVAASLIQWLAPSQANAFVALAMAVMYATAGFAVRRQNRIELAAC